MTLSPSLLAEAVALLALLAAAAFFSVSETSMIGVARHAVRSRAEAGDRRARRLDRMLDQPDRILSTVLVGNTIVTIGAATLSTAMADQLGLPLPTVLATVAMTLVVLVACELVPKTLAVANPLPFALRLAFPLRVVEAILKPFVAAAGAVSRATVRLFGVKPRSKTPYITSDEIEMLVRMGVESGHVERFEQRVISELFDFTETSVSKIMTPADKVEAILPKDATLEDATRVAARTGRSRILVVDGGFARVLGVLHIKDLLRYSDDERERLPAVLAIRSVLYAPHDLSADQLLTRMQKAHRMIAVIHDRAGRNLGIVTADDLLEELVGELHDEFDAARQAAGLRQGEVRLP